MEPETKRIAVLGAGWAGLYAAKTLITQGHDVTVFEQRSGLGGVWNWSSDPTYSTVSDFTETTSSQNVTQAHDFHYDRIPGMSTFPTNMDVLKYLNAYAEHFGVAERIEFNTAVCGLRRDEAGWAVDVRREGTPQETTRHFDRVVVCTGILSTPHIPPALRSSRTVHSHTVRALAQLRSLVAGKRVLVYGGGETSSDLLLNSRPFCESLDWSCKGLHGFKKRGFGINTCIRAYDDVDVITINSLNGMLRYGKPGMRKVCDLTTGSNLLLSNGHNIEPFEKSENRWGTNFFNKSMEVLPLVGAPGGITARPTVCGVDDATGVVTFTDGSSAEYDLIIACTGYAPRERFEGIPSSPVDCCKYVLRKDDPTLAYIGFARPTIGSFPLMAEYSCGVLQHYWAPGKPLPSRSELERTDADFRAVLDVFFDGQKSARLPTLVDPFVYYCFTRRMYPSADYRRYDNRTVKPWTLFFVTLLTFSPLESFMHHAALRIPMSVRNLFHFEVDDTIYLTRNVHSKEVAEYYKKFGGVRVVVVDKEYEQTEVQHMPRMRLAAQLSLILLADAALLNYVYAYRLVLLGLFVYRLYQNLSWRYTLYRHTSR
jgi:dimethylaniline monooxygenase (N-oxide forming)